METAFGFPSAAPAACTLVFTGKNGSRAWLATDACISGIVQRIVGDVAFHNSIPNLFLGPIREWTYFYKVKFLVPANDRGLSSIRALVASDGTCPSVHSKRCFPEHSQFSIAAALGWIVFVKGAAMECFVLHNG